MYVHPHSHYVTFTAFEIIQICILYVFVYVHGLTYVCTYVCVLGSVKYIGRLEDNPVLGTYIGVELDAPGTYAYTYICIQ